MSQSLPLRMMRRTITPYVGQGVIMLGVALFAVVMTAKSRDFGFVWAALTIATLFAVIVYLGLRYKIAFTSDAIYQYASGGDPISIRFEEIRRVDLERATQGEMLRGGRPFRRIAIYTRLDRRKPYIDISVRHFGGEDIRDFLTTLQKCRPDLKIPSIDGHVWSPPNQRLERP